MIKLKRAILARDQEIRDAVNRLNDMSQRLNRLVDQFSSSVVADDFSNPSDLLSVQSAPIVPSTPSISASTTNAAEAIRSPSRSADTIAHADVAHSTTRPQRASATSNAPTSLEAILAAARGPTARSTTTDRPKYAKMLRDLK